MSNASAAPTTNPPAASVAVAPAQPAAPAAVAPLPPKLNVEISKELGLVPKSIDELWRVARVVHSSGLAPKGFQREEQVFVALAYAIEMGMPMMSALQCLAVINGKVAMYGDAMLARVRGKPQFKGYTEWYEDEQGKIDMAIPGAIKRRDAAWKAKKLVAVARLDRKDCAEPTFGTFSCEDADRAKLIGKEGPWTTYPLRMLMWRARGFCIRDGAADLLNNMGSVEEAQDLPPREVEFTVHPAAPSTAFGRLTEKAAQLAEGSGEAAEARTADAPRDLTEAEMAASDAKNAETKTDAA
jgi:hypothetical protein